MLTFPRAVLLSLAAASLAFQCFGDDAGKPLSIKEAQTLTREEARFPATMRAIGVKEGRVELVIAVDDTGAVTDTFVVECTRRAFAQSALKSVESWTFAPASYDGEPYPSTVKVNIDFKLGRSLQWQTFTAPVETNIAQRAHEEQPITAAPIERLDSIPLPLQIVEPQRWANGRATIEFYIDELGNVRCPKLVSGNNLDFGRATMDAVSQWRFQPPMVNGVRTNTLVRQTFHFVDGHLATSESG